MSDVFPELRAFKGRHIAAKAGDVLFRRQDRIRYLYLVDQGVAHLVRYTETGGPIVMQRAQEGMLLAESSIFSERYHCDAVVAADLRAHCVSMAAVHRALYDSPGFGLRVAAHLAREVQRQRIRSEILAIRTVRDRLDAWLAFNGGGLPPKGQWKSVADEIGVSPEAFYRELARR